MFIVLNVKVSNGFTERAYNVGKISTIRHADNHEVGQEINSKVYYTDEDGNGCIAYCRETFTEIMVILASMQNSF